jgi:hypothetical protein
MSLCWDEGRTRIVCGYNPCYTKAPNTGTTYQQHRQYYIVHKKDYQCCPRTRFREDLLETLKQWRDAGNRLVICLDVNTHIYQKAIGKLLMAIDGLVMREVVGDFTTKQIGATFFCGSKPIDSVWATLDVMITNACIIPVG